MNTPRVRMSTVVTLGVIAAVLATAFAYRHVLIAWFTGPELGVSPAASNGAESTSRDSDRREPYSPATVDALRAAMDAYERIRAALASDDTQGVPDAARTLAEALDAAAETSGASKTALRAAADQAKTLTGALDLSDARKAFAALNATLVPLVGGEPSLVEGNHVFECSMYEDAQWVQRSDKLENPYMGRRMLRCGTESQWVSSDADLAGTGSQIVHYTCPMHPSVKQHEPGACPICGMDLTPVTARQQREGVVIIDDARRQLIGVRTAEIVEAPMRRELRVVARVTYDESAFTDVNLKLGGWITKLYVSETGQRVTRGQPLFELYSPDLYAAQQDLLLASRGAPAAISGGSVQLEQLVRAARKRLRLLGLNETQIDAIAADAEPRDTIAMPSPASGFVIEKNVVEGAAVQAGMRLFRIAALDKVWIEGDVYEEDLHLVHKGQTARVALDYLPGRTYDAKVSYVYPYLDSEARTGRVRVELANKELELRPGMYARIELSSELGTRLQVPAGAVVYTGPRRLVFVDLGEGRFKPQEVEIGVEAGGMYEVRSGLSAGDRVATSGVFLIAAEARISTAATYWEAERAANSADGPQP